MSRADVVDRGEPGFYHLTATTVRKRRLFERRDIRRMVRERIMFLADLFAIEVLFFSVLSNHHHLILRLMPEVVERLTNEQVIERAIAIFPYKFEKMGIKDGVATEEQIAFLSFDKQLVQTMRSRLCDPSWFERQLNQFVAFRVNEMLDESGSVFQRPFHATKIETAFALVICGLYVDLNEFQAGLSRSVATSRYSSAGCRHHARRLRELGQDEAADRLDGNLGNPFRSEVVKIHDGMTTARPPILGMTVEQYFELLDRLIEWTREEREKTGTKVPLPINDIAKVLSDWGVLSEISGDL